MKIYIVTAWTNTATRKQGEEVTRGNLAQVAGFMNDFSCGNRAACRAFLTSQKSYTAAPFTVRAAS